MEEQVLDHCRGGAQKMLPSAVAEAVVASIISTAGGVEGGGMGWYGGVVGDDGGGPVGRSLRWQVEVARVAGPL